MTCDRRGGLGQPPRGSFSQAIMVGDQLEDRALDWISDCYSESSGQMIRQNVH